MRRWIREEKLQAKEAAHSGALEQGGRWGWGHKNKRRPMWHKWSVCVRAWGMTSYKAGHKGRSPKLLIWAVILALIHDSKSGTAKAGEMTLQLRALTCCLKQPSSIPSTPMVAHNCPYLQCQRIQHPLLASTGIRHTWCTDIYAGKISIHRK